MHILSAQLPVNTVLSHSQLANSLFFAEVSVHRTKIMATTLYHFAPHHFQFVIIIIIFVLVYVSIRRASNSGRHS